MNSANSLGRKDGRRAVAAKQATRNIPLRRRGRLTEALIGFALSAVIALAALTSTGEIPFVYQGY